MGWSYSLSGCLGLPYDPQLSGPHRDGAFQDILRQRIERAQRMLPDDKK